MVRESTGVYFVERDHLGLGTGSCHSLDRLNAINDSFKK